MGLASQSFVTGLANGVVRGLEMNAQLKENQANRDLQANLQKERLGASRDALNAQLKASLERQQAGQEFAAGQRTQQQEFAAGEAEKGRQFRSEEADIGRATTENEAQIQREFGAEEAEKARQFGSVEGERGREFQERLFQQKNLEQITQRHNESVSKIDNEIRVLNEARQSRNVPDPAIDSRLEELQSLRTQRVNSFNQVANQAQQQVVQPEAQETIDISSLLGDTQAPQPDVVSEPVVQPEVAPTPQVEAPLRTEPVAPAPAPVTPVKAAGQTGAQKRLAARAGVEEANLDAGVKFLNIGENLKGRPDTFQNTGSQIASKDTTSVTSPVKGTPASTDAATALSETFKDSLATDIAGGLKSSKDVTFRLNSLDDDVEDEIAANPTDTLNIMRRFTEESKSFGQELEFSDDQADVWSRGIKGVEAGIKKFVKKNSQAAYRSDVTAQSFVKALEDMRDEIGILDTISREETEVFGTSVSKSRDTLSETTRIMDAYINRAKEIAQALPPAGAPPVAIKIDFFKNKDGSKFNPRAGIDELSVRRR